MEPSENGAVARREISRIEVLLEEMVSLGGATCT